uniref:Rho-GAP domain-containing protein n=1 Tax=Oryctolagus cuniculus TaxID=9986 RepID=A0A5F9DBU3_RABIT
MEERINTYAKILLLLDGPRMKLMATFQFISRAQEEDQPKGILLHVFAVDINNSTTVFLQANKESIFVTSLWDQGLGVLADANEDKEITTIQRLSRHFPKASDILWYMLGFFPKIFQHSSLHPKTTLNSPLCVVPSMLSHWPSTSRISSLEENQEISLVDSPIKNCLCIHRDDIVACQMESSLISPISFGKSPFNSDTTKHEHSFEEMQQSLEISLMPIISMDKQAQLKDDAKPITDSHIKLTQKQHPTKKRLCRHVLGRNHKLVPAPAPDLPISQQAPLFGSPLQDVCKNDKLPKPILDMLFIIDQKGPATKAIFSKCATFKDRLALKEKLNSRECVDWENACPIVVATVLKDLLQNIPGSILTVNFYEKFIGVLDEGNEEAKIAMSKRLLAQLPKPNVHLLQSLFRCLHKISQKSPSKEMTSSNLAWCITPSLLWPPVASILDIATEWEKKVALVQYLLDHCFKIFGSSLTSTIRKQTKYRKHYLEVSDPQLKPAQKQHSIKKWLTPRVLGRNQNRVAPEPARPTAHQAQLFGSLLQDVCENGKLPKSILDMLYFIDLKGSITEGIFKKCVNGQAYRTLREKLNSGEEVDWTTESPYVMATVLKDFLQSIPGSLFTTELYEKFIGAMDEGNKKARISIILRLLDQLPKMNFHLLECLFTCLYKIAHSPLNNMTSSDLSLYMTPSLLWIPISRNSERGMEWQRKVTLIQFLIDNCKNIFGHRLTSCMGGHTKYEDTFQELLGIMNHLTSLDYKRRQPLCHERFLYSVSLGVHGMSKGQ